MKRWFCTSMLLCCFLCSFSQKNSDWFFKTGRGSIISFEQLLQQSIDTFNIDTVRGLKLLFTVRDSVLKLNNKKLEGQVFYALGEALLTMEDYPRSFANFFKAKNRFEELSAEEEHARALLGMAKTQYYRGNYRMAADHLSTAAEMGRGIHNKQIEEEALEYTGLVFNAMPPLGYSSDYFKASLQIKKELKDEKGLLRIMEKLSDVCYQQKKYDSALLFAEMVIQQAGKMNFQNIVVSAQLSRIAVLIRLQRLQEASFAINRMNPKFTGKNDLHLQTKFQVIKGNLHLAENLEQKAMRHYDTALTIASTWAFPEMLAMIYKNIGDSYYEQKRFGEAYLWNEKYTQQLKNFYSADKGIYIKTVEDMFNAVRSKDEIKYLSNENKLNQEKLNNEKNLRLVLTAGLVLLIGLGSVIFMQYHRQRNKNSIIEKQSEELQTLMKEIHHRVKNNLQIISSLLDLQSLTIKDTQAAEAVKEGRNRVQSMALLHQNLYTDGNIRGVPIESYIHTLAQNLFDSYNIRPEKIKLITDIESLNLDIDTVIPIGLILNELISNSLKYAFKNRESGEIFVQLKMQDDTLMLKVKDNGNGFPPENFPVSVQSFGMKMIRAFSQKLKAKLEIYNDGGACVTMSIDRFKIA